MNEIDQYIAQYPSDLQEKLQEMRKIIQSAAPNAKEKISWNMPTFYMKRNIVHFAMFKNHIGLYPGASGVAQFANELKGYKYSKGSIQFLLNQPLPEELIHNIVMFRVEEELSLE